MTFSLVSIMPAPPSGTLPVVSDSTTNHGLSVAYGKLTWTPTYVDGNLFFTAGDGSHGDELWKVELPINTPAPTLPWASMVTRSPSRAPSPRCTNGPMTTSAPICTPRPSTALWCTPG